MADNGVIHIGENSPQHVAYRLLKHVVRSEGKALNAAAGSSDSPDRAYILDTYAECLRAVGGNPRRASG